jgi:hypothetical protein
MKLRSRLKLSGEGFLPIVIVVLVLIGGGLWYLYSNKNATDREAREFARDAVKRLTVDHDRKLLDDRLSPQAKLDMPPSQRDYLIQRLTQFGVPQQPIQMDENITFQSYFFEPSGIFTAQLNYPGQGAMLQMATSHPVSRWQIDNITFTTQRQAPPPAPAPAPAQPPPEQSPPAQSPAASPP